MKNYLCSLSIATFAAGVSHAAVFVGGHGDIGVALEDGTDFHLHLHLHEGTLVDGVPLAEDAEFDADAITIRVPLSTQIVSPADFPLAGVGVGDPVWALPQSNPGTDTIPFLGIATEELDPTLWSDITYTLGSVISPSGAGTFAFSQSGGLGLDFYMSSFDPSGTVNGDNTFVMTPGVHDHANWMFNEAGLWQVELSVSGVHDTLGFLSDTQTFSFSVVPEPSTYAAIAGALALAFVVYRRRRQ